MTSNLSLHQRPEFEPEAKDYHIQIIDQDRSDCQHSDQSAQKGEPSTYLQICIAFSTKMWICISYKGKIKYKISISLYCPFIIGNETIFLFIGTHYVLSGSSRPISRKHRTPLEGIILSAAVVQLTWIWLHYNWWRSYSSSREMRLDLMELLPIAKGCRIWWNETCGSQKPFRVCYFKIFVDVNLQLYVVFSLIVNFQSANSDIWSSNRNWSRK